MMTVPACWVTRHNSSNAKVMAQQSPPGTSPQRVAATSTLPRGTYLEKLWEILHRIQPTVFPACCGRVCRRAYVQVSLHGVKLGGRIQFPDIPRKG